MSMVFFQVRVTKSVSIVALVLALAVVIFKIMELSVAFEEGNKWRKFIHERFSKVDS